MVETPQPQSTQVKKPAQRSSGITDVLAIIAFIVLTLILLWGLFHGAALSSNWFSSFFSSFNSQPTSIQISAPKDVDSGKEFTMSWHSTTASSGMYTFLYQCQKGLAFKTTAASGASVIIPCGAAFPVGNGKTTFALTPLFAADAPQSVPLSIVFIPAAAGDARAEGSATVTVHPSAATSQPVVTPPAKEVTPPVVKKPAPVYSGPADLSVRIVSASIDASGNASVSFDIKNIGGSPSGTYSFEAHLPSAANPDYISPLQTSLHPGDHVLSTLQFNEVAQGGGLVTVVVDPQNLLQEASKTNNEASQTLSAPY